MHRVGADAARRAGDIDRLAGDRAGDMHRVIAGHRGDAETGAFDETRSRRQRLDAARGQSNEFRGRAVASPPLSVIAPDAISLAEAFHALAEAGDDACAIGMGNDAGKFGRDF